MAYLKNINFNEETVDRLYKCNACINASWTAW